MPGKPVTQQSPAGGSGLCPAGTEMKTVPNPRAGKPGEPPTISECVPLGMREGGPPTGAMGPRSGMAFPSGEAMSQKVSPQMAFNAMNEKSVRKAGM